MLPPLAHFLAHHTSTRINNILDVVVACAQGDKYNVCVCYLSHSTLYNVSWNTYTTATQGLTLLSMSVLCPGILWAEREAHDMYGIVFFLHPDLRRILTYYGFTYHALCKSFPVFGHVELSYCEVGRRIITVKTDVKKTYRDLNKLVKWLRPIYVR